MTADAEVFSICVAPQFKVVSGYLEYLKLETWALCESSYI